MDPKTPVYHAATYNTYMINTYSVATASDGVYPIYTPTNPLRLVTCAYCGRRTYLAPQTTSSCEGCGAPLS